MSLKPLTWPRWYTEPIELRYGASAAAFAWLTPSLPRMGPTFTALGFSGRFILGYMLARYLEYWQAVHYARGTQPPMPRPEQSVVWKSFYADPTKPFPYWHAQLP